MSQAQSAPGSFPPPPFPKPNGSGAPIIVLGMPPAQPVPDADLYVGAPRHLEVTPLGAATVALGTGGPDLATVLDRIAEVVSNGKRACVLAPGDPGFFGLGRALAERFGPANLEVHPAPSPLSLAFARLGLPWDDAVVVQADARTRNEALVAAHTATSSGRKVAVLASQGTPPEMVGHALLEARANGGKPGAQDDIAVAVCSRLGTAREQVELTDLAGLAQGSWDPASVVVLLPERALGTHGPPPAVWAAGGRSWLGGARFGMGAGAFGNREGMAATPEVRAVVLAKLDLPLTGVLWDVGAGNASVAIEAALLAPGLEVHAVEQDPRAATQARSNVTRHCVAVKVHNVHAPEALAGLPRPDRIFVGGGGPEVLDVCATHLNPGGRVVASFRGLGQAVLAAERLGSLVQVSVCNAQRQPGQGWALAADDPVFVAWGPERGPA